MEAIRTYTNVGKKAGYTKDEIDMAIRNVEWEPFRTKELPFMQGEALKGVIQASHIPVSKISRMALHNVIHRGKEEHGFYALDVKYKNGQAQIYVADSGVDTMAVASDFTSNEEDAGKEKEKIPTKTVGYGRGEETVFGDDAKTESIRNTLLGKSVVKAVESEKVKEEKEDKDFVAPVAGEEQLLITNKSGVDIDLGAMLQGTVTKIFSSGDTIYIKGSMDNVIKMLVSEMDKEDVLRALTGADECSVEDGKIRLWWD